MIQKFRLLLNKIALFALLCTCSQISNGQSMSGQYTIDKNSAASATNFKNWVSLANSLAGINRTDGGSNYTGGITGPVVIDVKNGVYSEQVIFTSVNGASSTNTITVQGNNQVLDYTGSKYSRATVVLDGADFFIFKNLIFKANDGLYAWCLHLKNRADNNLFDSCTFEMAGITAGTDNFKIAQSYIVIGASDTTLETSLSQAPNGFFNTFSNNLFKTSVAKNDGPTFGIFEMQGSSIGSTPSNNTYYKNKMTNFYYYGMYIFNTNGSQIVKNEVLKSGGSNNYLAIYGIYFFFSYGSDRQIQLDSNYVHDIPGPDFIQGNNTSRRSYGISFNYSNGNPTYRAKATKNIITNIRSDETTWGLSCVYNYQTDITNNLIYSLGSHYVVYGISLEFPTVTTLDYNTVYLDKTSTFWRSSDNGLYCFTYHSSQKSKVRGNVVALVGDNYYKTAIQIQHRDAKCWDTFDYNNYYIKGGGVKVIGRITKDPVSDTSYSISNWTTKMYVGPHETSYDPKFVNAANQDFRLNSFPLNNSVPLYSSTNVDFYNKKRNPAMTDKGAMENTSDLELKSATYKGGTAICGGYSEKLSITVKNNFVDTAFDFYVAFSLNNVKTRELISAKIAPGATYTHTFSSSVDFYTPGTFKLAIFIDIPDDNTSNDSTSYTINVGKAPSGSSLSFVSQIGLNAPYSLPGYEVMPYGKQIKYTFNSPAQFSNAEYGTKWSASAFAKTKGGAAVSGAMLTLVSPGTGDGMVVFTPDQTLVDSFIDLFVKIVDVNALCDTLIKSKILVASLPQTNFRISAPTCKGQLVGFENITTIKADSFSSKWYFGDGDTSNLVNPIHTYVSNGVYNVRLFCVGKKYGFAKDTIIPVTINDIPKVAFTAVNGCKDEAILFTNQSTGTPSSAIKFKWYFGDGNVSFAKDTAHLFTTSGAFVVKLVASINGCSDSSIKPLTIFDKPKTCDFKVSYDWIKGVMLFKPADGIGKTGAQSGVFYTWDFGSFGNSNDTNPTIVKPAVGNFLVQMTAKLLSSGCECKSTKIVNTTNGMVSLNSDIKLYPNPTKNIVFVNTNNFKGNLIAEIYSQDGKLVVKENLVISSKPLSINLQGLKAGLYIVRLSNEFERFNTKLIIE